MLFKVVFKRTAEREFDDLPAATRKRLARLIDILPDDPWPRGSQGLSGNPGIRRLRSGDYQVLYAEPDDEGVIRILRIAHRREVYRGL